MNDAPVKRRRFRFSLRMLMALVTLAAVASWGYWVAWPWWQVYRFESSLGQLKAGTTIENAMRISRPPLDIPIKVLKDMDDRDGVALLRYVMGNTVYCVYLRWHGPEPVRPIFMPCNSIAVYRLPRIPRYDSSDVASHDAAVNGMQPLPPGGILTDAYANYFLGFLRSDRKNNPGFQYELIYADPPAKPEAK